MKFDNPVHQASDVDPTGRITFDIIMTAHDEKTRKNELINLAKIQQNLLIDKLNLVAFEKL